MKRYLITGASRGIGRAIAEKLSAPDVVLLLHGRDTVALAEVCKFAKTQCAQVVPLIHDLALPSGVSKLIAEVVQERSIFWSIMPALRSLNLLPKSRRSSWSKLSASTS